MTTYVSPGFQVAAFNGIFVKALPFLKCFLCMPMMFFGIPLEHPLIELKLGTFAVCFNDACRVVEKIIGIDDADVHLTRSLVRRVGTIQKIGLRIASSDSRSDLAHGA